MYNSVYREHLQHIDKLLQLIVYDSICYTLKNFQKFFCMCKRQIY